MNSEQAERSSKYSEYFDRIKASPEQVAKAIMNSTARNNGEWKYRRKENSKDCSV